MGILSKIREKKFKFKANRVEKMKAGRGDRQARMKLMKQERKLLAEQRREKRIRADLQEERRETNPMLYGPSKAVKNERKERFRKGLSKMRKARQERMKEGGSHPFSRDHAGSEGAKTREILGGGSKGNSVFGGGGGNPFYDSPKKEKKEGGKTITVKIG